MALAGGSHGRHRSDHAGERSHLAFRWDGTIRAGPGAPRRFGGARLLQGGQAEAAMSDKAKEVLPAQPWMTSPASRAVMAALEGAGGLGCARFVGGCVRNALLRQPVEDIDIATTLTPPVVITALRGAGLKAIPTGVD